MTKPSVSRIVHYVSHGTPPRADGSQAFTSECRAAVITEVDPQNPARIGICVFNPTGLFFHPLAAGGCTYDEGGETPGDPNCPQPHGDMPFRYCPEPGCGWQEASLKGGTWHWPERV
ncbi:hypothetical protein [Saccharothrix xinjiangensis]|uniref:Uncharacterized protein n=1 Tax=Saccharothrix xinjiangensis TaxID=204798 RepID=A0ABV9XTA6_9PSEU